MEGPDGMAHSEEHPSLLSGVQVLICDFWTPLKTSSSEPGALETLDHISKCLSFLPSFDMATSQVGLSRITLNLILPPSTL